MDAKRNGRIFSALFIAGFAVLAYHYTTSPPSSPEGLPDSIYDITVKDISGGDVNLGKFRGKVLLIVNVASKCGLTHSNYRELNVLYERYRNDGLEILAFPCNQFGGQEPGDSEEIRERCSSFRAEFPVFDKVEVNGSNATSLYRFLKAQKGGLFGDAIKWNFTKFLVGRDGAFLQRYAPTSSPLSLEGDVRRILGV